MLASFRRSAFTPRTLARYSALGLFCLLCSAVLWAQVISDDATLSQIHHHLTSTEKLKYHQPVVFVGEITALGGVFQGPCKSAVSEHVEFTISHVLFGKFSDTVIHTGYINCTMQPLPSPPFTLHSTVIVYCEPSKRFVNCLNPVPHTGEREKTVKRWIAATPPELATEEESHPDASLETLHAPLLDPFRLAKKEGFLFDGVINRKLEIRQPRCSSGRERKIEYRVDEVLWDYPDSLLRPGNTVSKDVIDCRQAALPTWATGTRVLVYCEAVPAQGDSCLAPVRLTEDRLARVTHWIAELRAREGNPELLKMHFLLRDSLELSSGRPLLVLGKVTWVTPKS